jgi:hypothetical protein
MTDKKWPSVVVATAHRIKLGDDRDIVEVQHGGTTTAALLAEVLEGEDEDQKTAILRMALCLQQ